MRIKLSDHFTYSRTIRFVLPSIAMMIFTSIYYIVDGLFVSNIVGKTPFAAVNLIMPFLMILGALGFMIGAGGSAVIAKTLGERKPELANEYFSMLVYITAAIGILITVLGLVFMHPIAVFLGARGQLLDDCILYGNINMISMAPYMLQCVFQSFFIAAEKPKLGLGVTVAAGITNMVLDFLFIAVFGFGLAGAASATVTSEFVGGISALIYFGHKNNSLLQLTRSGFHGRIFLQTCFNGSSELVSEISVSFVGMIYNWQLLKFAGQDGVAAFGVMMYVNMIFMAIFFGYGMGIAPVVSYNYGARTHAELQNLFRQSIRLMLGSGIALTLLAELLAKPLCSIFVGYDKDLLQLTLHGFHILVFCFILMGFNVFGSNFFTALNNGPVSAVIALSRSFLFRAGLVMLPPIWLGLDGIWISAIVAELLSAIVTFAFIYSKRERYHYWP
jgi:Na+-driven multidrug efflux pump